MSRDECAAACPQCGGEQSVSALGDVICENGCHKEPSAAWVDLAPTLSEPVAQRYVLMHYGLGEPKLDAAAVAGAFQDRPLDAAEARIIAEGWHRG